jgi:hypothetical protein
MKNMKRFLWGLLMVAVALVGIALSNLPRSAAQAVAQRNSGAPVASAKSDPASVPRCSGPSGFAIADVSPGGPVCNRGFSEITHPDTGIYCLTLAYPPPPSRPVTAQVSVEWANSSGIALFAEYNSSNGAIVGSSCGGSPQKIVEVRTYKGDVGVANPGTTYSTGPALSDDVAFTVLVPLYDLWW